jgi:hypothetical protein
VLERAGEEVGEDVGAGLLLERLAHLLAAEHVVAVRGVDPRQVVERAVGAAVAIRDRRAVVALERRLDRRADPLRAVVEQGGHRHDLDVPAAAA